MCYLVRCAGAPICRPPLQAPLPKAQLWVSPEPWDADMVSGLRQPPCACHPESVHPNEARELGHILQPKYWYGQQLMLSMDTGCELHPMLMYKGKVVFATSFPSVSASIFHLLLGCRQTFV